MNVKKQLHDGLVAQNPVLVQLLGMCSTMAITTTLFNGIGMGFSVLIILTCSNVVISLLRKIIPNEIRIACYVVVIASFVTIVDLCLQAFLPDLAESLGVFIPLTLGSQGARCFHRGVSYRCPAVPLQAVDTTAAGDTFTGYFLRGILDGAAPEACLRLASAASALAVTRPGAADSVPAYGDVLDFLKQN